MPKSELEIESVNLNFVTNMGAKIFSSKLNLQIYIRQSYKLQLKMCVMKSQFLNYIQKCVI